MEIFTRKYNPIAIFIVAIIIFLLQVGLSRAEDKNLRIVSLAPATTEILFSLGLNENIVGVTSFCNYPAEATKKDKVGTFSQPSIEKIISLRPDIIFTASIEQAPIVEKLKKLNLNVYVSDPEDIEDLLTVINEIGKITDRTKEAKQLTGEMRSRMNQIKVKVKSILNDKRPKVFVEIWHDPLMTAGRGSFIDELISIAGGINIAYDTPRKYSYFSPEQVIKRDPDYIILSYMSEKDPNNNLASRLGWGNIKAVRNKHIYSDINPDLFLRPGPRLIEGLEEIHKKLYQR